MFQLKQQTYKLTLLTLTLSKSSEITIFSFSGQIQALSEILALQ